MIRTDAVDYLTNTVIEPIRDPLHAGEPEDEARIKEVRESVNWAKRLTYNADGVSQKAIDAIINSRSIGIVGKDVYTGETDVAIATPQFTANTDEAQRKVMKSIRSRLKVVINNAAKSRLISPEKADALIDEVPLRILGSRFQPHKEPRPYQKEPERKNVYSGGYTKNEQVISGPKKAILVIAGSSFLLSSCAVVPTAVETAVATATQQANQSVDVPIGVPTESPKPTSEAHKTPTPDIETRAPVTAEDVKNVEDPIQISLDKSGKLTGFPENTPKADIEAARPFYDAVAAKFLLSKVFYTKDPVSGQFALYAVSPDGKLYFSTVSYSDGPAQFNDYPVTYESANGGWRVSGSYVGIDIPGGTWSTIWKNGFLQFIANKQELSDGSYYTKYMVNQTLASENPWQNVPGISEAPSGPEIADALDVANYQIVDGSIQEKRGNAWQEVSVPYEEGYIAYVEIHDGKAYGIDTADRAVVVRNDETGEWEKFDRPIFGADFDNYVYEDEFSIITLTIDQSNLDLSDVPVTEINRLDNSEGDQLKWGYLGDTKDWDTNYDMFDFVASGYLLDIVNIHGKMYGKETKATYEEDYPPYFVFEIPHKYYRQIVIVQNPPRNFTTYIMTGNYPDVSESYEVLGSKLNDYLVENIETIRGQQIILNLGLSPSNNYSQLFWNSQLTENEGYNYPAPMQSGFFWFGSNFPINKVQ